MTRGSRGFALSALTALVVAGILHLLVMAGAMNLWPAMVHLLLFGWITGMILAVSYHTMPVFSGRDFPYPSLIEVHCVVFALGVTATTGALIIGAQPMAVTGLAVQLLAALLFLANTALLFRRGAARPAPPLPPSLVGQRSIDRVGSIATRGATLCLPLALVLLLAVHARWLGAAWLLAAEHIATLGWIMLMITGVGVHVLPRFSGRSLRGARWVRAQVGCHAVALCLIVLALGFGWPAGFAAGAMLMAVAIGLFAWAVWPAFSPVRAVPPLIQVSFKEQPR